MRPRAARVVLRHARPRLRRVSRRTATMVHAPIATVIHWALDPRSRSPSENAPTVSAPTSAPSTEPRPPPSETPPMTAAVMASMLMSSPTVGVIEPIRPIMTHPANAEIRPAPTYAVSRDPSNRQAGQCRRFGIVAHSVCMPAPRRAGQDIPERCKQKAGCRDAERHDRSAQRNGPAEQMKKWRLRIDVLAPDGLVPRDEIGGSAENLPGPERHDEGRQTNAGGEHAVDGAASRANRQAGNHSGPTGPTPGEDGLPHHDHGQDENSTEREVDSAGHDHQRLRGCDHSGDCHLLDDERQSKGRKEGRPKHRSEDRDCPGQHQAGYAGPNEPQNFC